jgi:OFA family oxalate/formate antiporter-like MFS transporter
LGVHLGYDITQYVYILIGFNIMNGVGRLVCGRLSDSLPKQRILAFCFTVSAGAYRMFLFFDHLVIVAVLSALVGLSFGCLFTVSAPLVSECFGLANFGRVFGLVFTAYGFVAGMLGPWLSGVILDRTQGNFDVVFIYFAAMYLIAAILILKVVPVTLARQ